ncbi:MAG: insulinase family protein [Acidobacteria bacterium]|nr:insulinase family protein [Acidobacteriota bacterium]
MKWKQFLIGFAWVATSALAQQPPPSRPQSIPKSQVLRSREDHGNITRAVLANGMTVLVEDRIERPLAAVASYFRRGWSDEPASLAGASRLLSRLREKLPTQSGTPFKEQLGELGAISGSDVGPDHLFFYDVGPAENVVKIIEARREALQNLRIDPQVLQEEIAWLVREGQQLTQDYFLAAHDRMNALLDLRRVSAPPISRELDAVSLNAYSQRIFRPSNHILVVSGAVDRHQLLQKIVQVFSSPARTPPGAEKGEETAATGKNGFRYFHVRADVTEPYLLLALRLPAYSLQERIPALLLQYVLGEGRGALLTQEGKEVAANVSSAVQMQPGLGMISFFLKLEPDKVDASEGKVFSVLEQIRAEGTSAAELERAKALLLRDYLQQLEALESRAYLLARNEAEGNYRARDRMVEDIQKVTQADMAAFLKRHVSEQNLALLEYFPKSFEQRMFTSESFLEAMKMMRTGLAEREPLLNSVEPLGVSIRAAAASVPAGLKKTSILRGPEILLLEDNKAPLVHVGFFYSGGRIQETPQTAGVTELALRVLLESAGGEKSSQWWATLEQMGARLQPVNEPDFFGFQSTVLPPYLEPFLKTMGIWLKSPPIDPGVLGAELAALLSTQETTSDGALKSIFERLKAAVFENHPYGLPSVNSQAIQTVSLESLQSWVKASISSVHPLIVIHGNVQGTGFLQDVAPVLADAARKPVEPARVATASPKSTTREFSLLSVPWFAVAFSSPPRNSLQEHALRVLENLTRASIITPSVSFTADFQAHPERWHDWLIGHDSYAGGGIFYSLSAMRQGGPSTVGVLEQNVKRIAAGEVRTDEFLKALDATIAHFYIHRQRGDQHVRNIGRDALSSQRPATTESEILRQLKEIKREDLQEVAREYLWPATDSEQQ